MYRSNLVKSIMVGGMILVAGSAAADVSQLSAVQKKALVREAFVKEIIKEVRVGDKILYKKGALDQTGYQYNLIGLPKNAKIKLSRRTFLGKKISKKNLLNILNRNGANSLLNGAANINPTPVPTQGSGSGGQQPTPVPTATKTPYVPTTNHPVNCNSDNSVCCTGEGMFPCPNGGQISANRENPNCGHLGGTLFTGWNRYFGYSTQGRADCCEPFPVTIDLGFASKGQFRGFGGFGLYMCR